MKTNSNNFNFATIIFIMCLFVFFLGTSFAGQSVSLPKTMIWTAYDVGTTAYLLPAGIAATLSRQYDCKIRIMPSSTGVGRLIPLKTKKAKCAFLGNETFFAVEGLYEFIAYEWGPQDLRVILGRENSLTFVCTKTSGIKTVSDLKGKRVSYIPGNPSVNVKAEGMLAFAGLTWNDVIRVEFPSWTAQMEALIEGKTDASACTTDSEFLHRIASSPRGLYRPPFPPDDRSGWKRVQKICPFLYPAKAFIGPEITKDNPVDAAGYRFPIIAVYADEDPEFVYNLIKAFDSSYPLYKDSHPAMPYWKIEEAGLPPSDAPFHPGAIKYLKEKNIWKTEHDAWNNKRMHHIKRLQELWEDVVRKAEAEKIGTTKLSEFWLKQRAKALETLD